MYSRDFSDKRPHLPPRYGGTAFTEGEPKRERRICEDTKAAKRECEGGDTLPPTGEPPCERPRGRGFLDGLLPFDLKGDDLLLLGLALLLLNDGCEDEYLPLLLLFLLIVH